MVSQQGLIGGCLKCFCIISFGFSGDIYLHKNNSESNLLHDRLVNITMQAAVKVFYALTLLLFILEDI